MAVHISFHEGFGEGRVKGWYVSRPSGRFECYHDPFDNEFLEDDEPHEEREYLHSDGRWRNDTCVGDVWSGYFESEDAARDAARKAGVADSEIQTD